MTFSPEVGDLKLMLGGFLLTFLALAFLAFRLNKLEHPDPRRRVLLPMLAYFIALLALMGAMGSFWSIFKYPTVRVEASEVFIDGEAHRFPRAGNVRFETTDGADRILLVQTADRRTWAFPADRYAVNELYRALRRE